MLNRIRITVTDFVFQKDNGIDIIEKEKSITKEESYKNDNVKCCNPVNDFKKN